MAQDHALLDIKTLAMANRRRELAKCAKQYSEAEEFKSIKDRLKTLDSLFGSSQIMDFLPTKIWKTTVRAS